MHLFIAVLLYFSSRLLSTLFCAYCPVCFGFSFLVTQLLYDCPALISLSVHSYNVSVLSLGLLHCLHVYFTTVMTYCFRVTLNSESVSQFESCSVTWFSNVLADQVFFHNVCLYFLPIKMGIFIYQYPKEHLGPWSERDLCHTIQNKTKTLLGRIVEHKVPTVYTVRNS